jgi:hypothetical protein
VRDRRSYSVINDLSLSPRMALVVWHAGSYVDVTTELWDRGFGFELEDVAPPR